MFDRFGEFNSAEEINETAVNLRKEGDVESIRVLAKENGIDVDIAEVFIEGDILYICDDTTAAIGKLDIETGEVKCREIMEDWVEYIKSQCLEKPEIARAVRSKGKNLAGCITALLTWGFKHQYEISKEIIKASRVSAGKVTMGTPGMATAKKIIGDYYLGR